MPDHRELLNRLEKLIHDFDKHIEFWAISRANYNKESEMKKITLNLISSGQNGRSEAENNRRAYCSPKYEEFLSHLFKIEVEFYTADMKKHSLQNEIDATRTLISFEKGQMLNT